MTPYRRQSAAINARRAIRTAHRPQRTHYTMTDQCNHDNKVKRCATAIRLKLDFADNKRSAINSHRHAFTPHSFIQLLNTTTCIQYSVPCWLSLAVSDVYGVLSTNKYLFMLCGRPYTTVSQTKQVGLLSQRSRAMLRVCQ